MPAKKFTLVGKYRGIIILSSIKSEKNSSFALLEGSVVIVTEKATVCWRLAVSVRHSSAAAFFRYKLKPGADKIFGVLVMGSMVIVHL